MDSLRGRGGRLIASLLFALHCGAALAQAYPGQAVRLHPAVSLARLTIRWAGRWARNSASCSARTSCRTTGPGPAATWGSASRRSLLPTAIRSCWRPRDVDQSLAFSKLRLQPGGGLHRSRVTAQQNVMVVHPSVPAKSLKPHIIASARAHPGKLTFASGGPGTTNHLANELLEASERIGMVRVP